MSRHVGILEQHRAAYLAAVAGKTIAVHREMAVGALVWNGTPSGCMAAKSIDRTLIVDPASIDIDRLGGMVVGGSTDTESMRQALSHLLQRVLRGENRELDAAETYSAFEARVVPDLRTGVEHTPVLRRTRAIDLDDWRTMEEYWMLVADAKLLRLRLPDSVLCRIHEKLLERVPLSESEIDSILRDTA